MTEENADMYHRYVAFVKCGIDIDLSEDDLYFFPVIAENEAEASRTALEISIKTSIAEVF